MRFTMWQTLEEKQFFGNRLTSVEYYFRVVFVPRKTVLINGRPMALLKTSQAMVSIHMLYRP